MNLNWFGNIIVHHPFVILSAVGVFSGTCLIIPFMLKTMTFPHFQDPQLVSTDIFTILYNLLMQFFLYFFFKMFTNAFGKDLMNISLIVFSLWAGKIKLILLIMLLGRCSEWFLILNICLFCFYIKKIPQKYITYNFLFFMK